MRIVKNISIIFVFLMQSSLVQSQDSLNIKSTVVRDPSIVHKLGATSFAAIQFTEIPGAPKLSGPVLITGTEGPVRAQGKGLAAPAYYDWDADGIKDLLIGEFGSGTEFGNYTGNFVRIYKNTGTNERPTFTGRFDYARPPFKAPGNGTPYSVDQFCCIGFTPQFVDLNNDGNQDMITGSYYGEVYWFEKDKEGFKQGISLSQKSPKEGDPRNGLITKKSHQYYWLYSSASFGDLTGDGLPDLIVGGLGSLRLSQNIGTVSEPAFDKRELLLNVNGQPLKIYDYNAEELNEFETLKSLGYEPYKGGDADLSPYVVDWDSDGVLDLLVTNSYTHEGLAVVDFFKGSKTVEGLRFQSAIPLFTTQDNKGKAFPGMAPRIAVVDWNNDGINDLLIGTSIASMNNKFSDKFSWQWQKQTEIGGPGKPPALLANLPPADLKRFKETNKFAPDVSADEYLKINYEGYLYVMLGKK